MVEAESIANLKSCLRIGGNIGRINWNGMRDSPSEWAVESLPGPLTVQMSNGVHISLKPPNLWLAKLRRANLSGYNLSGANLCGADLAFCNLEDSDLSGTNLIVTNLRNANLRNADLSRANLLDANLTGADLTGATLVGTQLLRTNITGTTFDGCNVHGAAVWGATGEAKSQVDLKITTADEPTITVDDIEVGQFVYLLLNNRKIRNVLQTVTSKVVLILGRFTAERKDVLDQLRVQLRKLNLSPVLFDFDPAANLDISDTVTLLARMARFIIADITDPRSVQQELTMIAPNVMVAICPILLETQEPWAMFSELQRRSHGMLPICRYRDIADLLSKLATTLVPALEARRADLLPSAA